MNGYEADELIDVRVEGRPGLEVMCRSISIGRMLDTTERRALGEGRDASLAMVRAAVETLSEALVSWNMTRQGVPVPADEAGVRSLGPTLLMDIYTAYMGGAVTVNKGSDLGKDSPSGEPSPGGFVMTDLPSSNLPNTEPPSPD